MYDDLDLLYKIHSLFISYIADFVHKYVTGLEKVCIKN
jgi:hypothetical protein